MESSAKRTHFVLPGGKNGNDNSLLCIGVSGTAMDSKPKQVFSFLVLEVFVRWSMILGESIVSLNGKNVFKLYMYIHTSTSVYYRFLRLIVNSMVLYDF